MTDSAALARQLARTLEHLGATWDVQYVGAEPMPRPTVDPTSTDAGGQASADGAMAMPEQATPESADVDASSAVASGGAVAPSAGSPPGDRPATDARGATAPSSGDRLDAQARDAAARTAVSPLQAAGSASGTAAPAVDSAQRAEAAEARRVAFREQALRWSPATKLEYLRRKNVGDCKRCPLCRTRNQIVFGVGNANADIMFVGEAPGADEDRQGEPFVGRAGQLLNRWLPELGLRREDVYISNVLKCRPPGNRDPRPQEVERCSPFLQAQIRAIEPKVIIALGRHAGMLLSRREDMTLRAMRGSRLHYDAGAPKNDPSARLRIPLVVTYHPAYVLRQQGDGQAPTPGRASPTEMVMTDLKRALQIASNTTGS